MNSLFDNDDQGQQQQYQQPPPQQNYQGGGQQYNQNQHQHNSYQQNARYGNNNRNFEGTMPFGKHKGVLVAELPADYLVWLWFKRVGQPLRNPLRQLVMDALRRHRIDPMGPMPPAFENQPRNAGWNNQTNNAYQGNQNQDYQQPQNYGEGQWQQ